MRRLTQEEFVSKAKSVFPKYDYSLVVYVNNKEKVTIICPLHGKFEVRPDCLLKGTGCPKCGGTKKMTTEEFIEKARMVHGDYFNYDKTKYINSNEKVVITCPIHGDFEMKANNHLYGQNCPKCRKDKLTHPITLLPKVNKSTHKLTTSSFIERCKNKWGDRYTYENVLYERSNKFVSITCREHGDFSVTPNHFLAGRGCPKCGGCHRLTTSDFVEKASIIHGNKYDYSFTNYVNTHNLVKIVCPKHGVFLQSPANHLKGENCPQCNQSKMEEKVMNALKEHYIRFDQQKKFIWLKKLSLDFYLPDFNIAIECQGIQHFEPIDFFGGEKGFQEQIKRDKIKNELCNKHGIKIIYYADYDFYFPIDVKHNLMELLESLK